MSRIELLSHVADEVSVIVAGALAANGEDDSAHWDLVQKLRHKYALPLLTEAQVQAGIQRYWTLTQAQRHPLATATSRDALEEFSDDRSAPATRADLRAVVVVEAALSSDGPITLQMVYETDLLLTQLGNSIDRLHHKRLLSKQLVDIIEATGYAFADKRLPQLASM